MQSIYLEKWWFIDCKIGRISKLLTSLRITSDGISVYKHNSLPSELGCEPEFLCHEGKWIISHQLYDKLSQKQGWDGLGELCGKSLFIGEEEASFSGFQNIIIFHKYQKQQKQFDNIFSLPAVFKVCPQFYFYSWLGTDK